MKKLQLVPSAVLSWLVPVLLIVAPTLASAADSIQSFEAFIEVAPDSSLTVTETITLDVAADGALRRGFARDIPIRYRDEDGKAIEAAFSLLSVRLDGAAAAHSQESLDGALRLHLGEPGVPLSPGAHVFELSYEITYALQHGAAADSLYWPVTGHALSLPVRAASATVRLPGKVQPTQLTALTGPAGKLPPGGVAEVRPDGDAHFRASAPLTPGVGLALRLSFPAGLVTPLPEQRLGDYQHNPTAPEAAERKRPAWTNWLGVLAPLLLTLLGWSRSRGKRRADG